METFSALLAIFAGNSSVSGEFPAQRPVTRSFDVVFDLCLNKRLSKQWLGWWFETPSCPLWRHRNEKSLSVGTWQNQRIQMNRYVFQYMHRKSKEICTNHWNHANVTEILISSYNLSTAAAKFQSEDDVVLIKPAISNWSRDSWGCLSKDVTWASRRLNPPTTGLFVELMRLITK